MIDKLDIAKFGSKKQLQNEIQRYEKFTNGILGQDIETKKSKVDIQKYAEYVIKNGTREEKRELLGGLKKNYISRIRWFIQNIKTIWLPGSDSNGQPYPYTDLLIT